MQQINSNMGYNSWSFLSDRKTVAGETLVVLFTLLALVGAALPWTTGLVEQSGIESFFGNFYLFVIVIVAAITYHRPWDAYSMAVVIVSGYWLFTLPFDHVASIVFGELGGGGMYIIMELMNILIEGETGVESMGSGYGTGLYLSVIGGLGVLLVGSVSLRNETITESWRLELLGILGLIGLGFLFNYLGLPHVLTLIQILPIWIALPVVVYCDAKYLKAKSDWTPKIRRWIIGLLLPWFNILIALFYLYRRRGVEIESQSHTP